MPHPSLGSEQGSFMPHSTVNLSDEETLKAEEEEDLLTAFQDIDKARLHAIITTHTTPFAE